MSKQKVVSDTLIPIFNSGDYVKTTNGDIGVIESPERWNIIDGDGRVVYGNVYPNISLEDVNANILIYWKAKSDVKTHDRKAVRVLNKVKVGDKVHSISGTELTKLDTLKIRTQQGLTQYEIELPITDAKMIIDIYKRNKIWFTII